MHALVRLCDHMDCSLPGSSVHGISQAGILEWVAISSSRGFSQPRDQTRISLGFYIGRGRFFTTEPPGKPKYADAGLVKPRRSLTSFQILLITAVFGTRVEFAWHLLERF